MRDANRCPVVMVVVSNAILGRLPMSPRIVARTACCTRGSASAVNFEMRSEGDRFETTRRYGFLSSISGEGGPSNIELAEDGPTKAEDDEFVVVSVGASSAVSSSNEMGKLVSLMYCLARFRSSDSSLAFKKLSKASSSSSFGGSSPPPPPPTEEKSFGPRRRQKVSDGAR